MNFGNWDENIHNDIEQIKRTIFMRRIKDADITLDTSSETASIVGSEGVYNVSLNHCTCYDFETRRLPCKHIYRLAHELGCLGDQPKTNRSASKAFKENLPAEIEHFKELYFSGAISGEKFVKIVNALSSK